ncbi:MAG: aminotransferase class I/II-fold pyridoxal phosphate-dependent enzyme [Candidatus Omnitrophica bacterium]|nr:aminotransferase class I/II-fold pyridoxal phosphate-dependent enzyme [Candidatus Omnitrophota bacterium]
MKDPFVQKQGFIIFNMILLDAPNLGSLEKEYAGKAIDAGFISTFGPFVPEFEKKFAAFIGADAAVSLQSGTAALHMALHQLGIGPGDEVIIPALTFVGSVNPVMYTGAVPVFVDVEESTWCLDPAAVERAITSKTKAIIAVHLYGNVCAMTALMNIAKRHNIHVIEDATESLGAVYNGKATGLYGTFGCFSFNGNKLITTGGGGMLVSSDSDRLEPVRRLINQGKDKTREGFFSDVGFNYRMTNLEASVGLAQMQRIDDFLRQKRKYHVIYREELSNFKRVIFPQEPEGGSGSWWLTPVRIMGENMDILRQRLVDLGVQTRRVFRPLTDFPPFAPFSSAEYKNARLIYEQGLCLPGSTLNSKEDIREACRIIKNELS